MGFVARFVTSKRVLRGAIVVALAVVVASAWRCSMSSHREKHRRESLTGWLGDKAASLVLQQPDLAALKGRDFLGMIADKRTTYAEFLLAVEALERSGRTLEEPSYWSRIANSAEYQLPQRRVCGFELLRRHAHAGMTLGELANLLDKPTWLTEEAFFTNPLTFLTSLPIKWRDGDALLIIATGYPLSASFTVYLTVRGQQDRDVLGHLLLTGQGARSLQDERIRSLLMHPSDLAAVELALMRLGNGHGCVRPDVTPAIRRDIVEDALSDR